MRGNSQTWLNVSIGLLLCLVVVNGGVAYRNLHQLRTDAGLVSQTHEVLEALETAVSTVKDAETGQRGYLLSGEEAYLIPYQDALSRSGAQWAKLEALVAANPQLAARVARLKKLVSAKLDELAITVAMRKRGEFEGAREVFMTAQDKQSMDRIRALVDDLQAQERRQLAERRLADNRAYRSAVLGIVVSALAGIVALVALLWLLRGHLNALAQSSRSIAEHRELLRATLASIGDGVIATDERGRVTFLNAVAERLTGWTQQEAAGAELESVFRVVDATTRETLPNPALAAVRAASIVKLSHQAMLVAKDATQWPIDDSAAPIWGSRGEVTGSVLVFREISQQRRHEAAVLEHAATLAAVNARMRELLGELKASEELFHTMADSIPQLAWMARADGHIYWYNKRWYEYTGTTLAEMEGWGWQSVHDPQELPRVLALWKAALKNGQPWEDTFPIRRKDGAMRWHLSRAEPLRNEQGEITCWFGTNTDITERREMEDTLREADRRKDEFLATLAHELRNPIAPISNALQIWPSVENDRQEMQKLRALVEPQVRQMTRLIDDLLDVSRITQGKIALRRQPLDLTSIIAGAVEVIRPVVDSGRQRLTVDVAERPLVVDGDAARLMQALGNLLQNAAKYTGPDGEIRVTAARDGDQAVVRVADSGVGISAELLPRVFEMFEQGDQTLARAHGGLGLGLTLVKQLVELHGGTVEARSEGPGKGSEFIVRLPIGHPPDVGHPCEQPSPRERASLLPRRRILVVDDVRASAKTLAMMLECIGQDVAIARDGAEAIEQVEADRRDVVFLDIAMPGMNGYDVARHLRARPESAELVLVALTGYGNEEDRRKSLAAGFDHHLTKPTSIEELAALLGALPEHARREHNAAPLAD
jgi:PAS domain S-box-containing protein